MPAECCTTPHASSPSLAQGLGLVVSYASHAPAPAHAAMRQSRAMRVLTYPGRLLAAYREAYRGLPRATWVLAAVFFVNRCGTMVLPFLALYLTTQRGLGARQVGLLLT